MTTIGYILMELGIMVGLAGEIMILTAVYRRGVILFVACLVIPCADLAFALVHFRRLWLPLVMLLGGVLIAWSGVELFGAEQLAEAIFG